LTLVELGTELIEDGNHGTRIQLAREFLCANGETHRLPLKYESEGIKKITSILQLLIAAYNNPSITLTIDELAMYYQYKMFFVKNHQFHKVKHNKIWHGKYSLPSCKKLPKPLY